MSITNGYTTATDFTTRFLAGQSISGTTDQYAVEQIISAASRLIDDYCGRVFYSGATAGEARYFTADSSARCYLDDYQSISAVEIDYNEDETYSITLSATADYRTMPAQVSNGWPYLWLEIRRGSQYHFPRGLSVGVKVTAIWGWSAVPNEIREACLLQSFRMYKRQAAPFGVVGGGELGTVVAIPAGRATGLDPDVETMLTPFVRKV